MTANTLYYTLSTIAQTLAGAFALMAAFVVFRLQFATARITETAWTVARAGRLVRLYRESKFKEVYDGSERSIQEASALKPYLGSVRRELGQLLALKKIVTRRFWFSTSFTAAALLYSVVSLSLVDAILKSPRCAALILTVGVLLFAICLLGYALVLYAALDDRR